MSTEFHPVYAWTINGSIDRQPSNTAQNSGQPFHDACVPNGPDLHCRYWNWLKNQGVDHFWMRNARLLSKLGMSPHAPYGVRSVRAETPTSRVEPSVSHHNQPPLGPVRITVRRPSKLFLSRLGSTQTEAAEWRGSRPDGLLCYTLLFRLDRENFIASKRAATCFRVLAAHLYGRRRSHLWLGRYVH